MAIDGVGKDEADGAAVYNKAMLAVYDLYVLQLSNSLAWRCPRGRMLENYDQNLGATHLDIGPGTGWYLRNATFPVDSPAVTLMDLNSNTMEMTSRRLAERNITATTHVGSILQPISSDLGRFDSVAANFVFHCVPGTWAEKGVAVEHIAAVVADTGVFFGSTILSKGVKQNIAAKTLSALYNGPIKSFHNRKDDLDGLKIALEKAFGKVHIDVVGSVAIWSACQPRRAGA